VESKTIFLLSYTGVQRTLNPPLAILFGLLMQRLNISIWFVIFFYLIYFTQ